MGGTHYTLGRKEAATPEIDDVKSGLGEKIGWIAVISISQGMFSINYSFKNKSNLNTNTEIRNCTIHPYASSQD